MVLNNASSIHKRNEKSHEAMEPPFQGRCHVDLIVEYLEQNIQDSSNSDLMDMTDLCTFWSLLMSYQFT